ncbi:MAG: class I SAM-dependent methyltransferase [Flavobacteriales bacterium]|nr:class I SAM-dependent methyltransferase [Flavobacteriales bacterium]
MSNTPCTYCKTTDSVELYGTYDTFGNDYTLRECNQCEAVFLTPAPDDELLAQAYDESYYGEGEEKFNEGLIEKMLDYFRRQRAKLVAKNTVEGGKVLDIGCGNGRFLSFVKEEGNFDIQGIEMEGGSADRAERIEGLNLKRGTLESSDFEENSIDAITMFHVFEHLTEPAKTLEIMSNIIKPNGVVVMSFPNIDSFQSRFFKGDWLHLDPPRHLFFFRPKLFKAIMKAHGFELVRERYFSIEYNPFGFQQSLLNKLFKKREVLYESLKGNKEYVKEYSSLNLLLQNLFFKLSAPLFILMDAVDSLFSKGATVEFVFRKKG